jgi:hypothetical protein
MRVDEHAPPTDAVAQAFEVLRNASPYAPAPSTGSEPPLLAAWRALAAHGFDVVHTGVLGAVRCRG